MRAAGLPSAVEGLAEGKSFYLLLALIILGGLVLRTLYLNADPPIGITNSQDFSTDPFSYVYFAENKINFGDANPYNDQRWILYEKSTQTLAALLVYSIFGTGRAEGNLVGVLLNLLAILMVALGIKNFGSRLGGLMFALLAGINYTLVHFARAPFLEGSQNLWLCAAFYLFSIGRRHGYWMVAAGMATAAAAFFGKMVALYGAGVYFLALLVFLFSNRSRSREIIKQAVRFYAGYLVVFLFWLLFTYLPSSEQVSHYLSEQGVGLYGAPRALEGVSMFFQQMLTLLVERDFFTKLPLVTMLGSLFGAFVIYSALKRRPPKENSSPNIGWLILLFWAALAFVALFPFNYRPLRYQTTLMFPMMALASLMLVHALGRSRSPARKGKGRDNRPSPLAVGIAWGIWLMPMLYAVFVEVSGKWGEPGSRAALLDGILLHVLLLFLLGIAAAFAANYVGKLAAIGSEVMSYVAVLLVLGYAAVQFIDYAKWVTIRQETLVTADRDLGAVLAADAVVSGSYATALTAENGLACVHHMFGLKYVDPDFFDRFPITHLVIDEGNEQRARQDYPEVMSQAQLLATYGIRGFSVKLFRVSGATGNEEASAYQPTAFEKARYWVDRENNDSARVYFERYIEQGIPNYSADLALGTAYFGEGNYHQALDHLRRVYEFSNRDVLANYYLGNAYLGVVAGPEDEAYFDSALVHLKFARQFLPHDQRLAQNVEQLERRK